MQILDIIFIVLLGLLVLRGFLKGFTGEFFAIAAVALGLITAFLFYRNGGAFLRSRYLDMAILPEIIAFLLIFLVVFLAGKLLEHIVQDIITRLNFHIFDRVLGIFLGLAEAFALILLILFILVKQPLFDPLPLLHQSLFARLLLPFIGGGRV